jgi:DNA-binding CsgD family transcriptional regulator
MTTWTRTSIPRSSSWRSVGPLGARSFWPAPTDWVGFLADGIDRRRHLESRLTRREQEVLKVAAQDLTAREVARHLGVRERTVTTHLGRIYRKLGVKQPGRRGDRGGAIGSPGGWPLGGRVKHPAGPDDGGTWITCSR